MNERRENEYRPDAQFNRARLSLRPMADRTSQLRVHQLQSPPQLEDYSAATEWKDMLVSYASSRLVEAIDPLADEISSSIHAGCRVVLFLGAHPIKLGLSPYLTDLVQRGLVSHVAMSGAGLIHEWELAIYGATSERVVDTLPAGMFGLWEELEYLNNIVFRTPPEEGLGTAAQNSLAAGRLPEFTAKHSLLVATSMKDIPCTVHSLIGGDVNHMHASFDPARWGIATYADFLKFANSMAHMNGGVFVNVGSATTGPEIFQKSLSMARNIGHVSQISTGVLDLRPAPQTEGEPPQTDPDYYFRPYKTLICRAPRGDGNGYYVCGDHRDTIPLLHAHLVCGSF